MKRQTDHDTNGEIFANRRIYSFSDYYIEFVLLWCLRRHTYQVAK